MESEAFETTNEFISTSEKIGLTRGYYKSLNFCSRLGLSECFYFCSCVSLNLSAILPTLYYNIQSAESLCLHMST